MTGMIQKDFLVARKNVAYYFGFLVFYGFLAGVGVFPYSILAGMVTLVGLMLPMSSFSYDELAKWEKFAVASPAGRAGVVRGKYAFALLCILFSGVLVSALLALMTLLGTVEVEVWWEPLAVVGVCACITLLLDSIFLPFLLKYGAEKARLMSILVFVVVFGGMAVLAVLVEGGFSLPELPPEAAVLAPVLLVAVTLAALWASCAVSLRIYEKKEL